MDNTLPNQQIEQPQVPANQEVPNALTPKDKGNKKGLLFGLIFVGIVLILLFGTLNYFNVLRLSELFPNQLGWLPHRPYQQYNNLTILPTIAPPISPTQQAKQTLTNFLPTILSPVLIPEPSQITIEQDKNPLGKTFISSWGIKESTIAAIVIVADNKNISQLYLSLQRPQNIVPSVKLASASTSELFSVKPKGEWGCKPIYATMTYCENFWEENDGARRGLAMRGLFTQEPNLIGGQSEAMLIFCEHTKESKIYSWKSCEFEFKETGMQ